MNEQAHQARDSAALHRIAALLRANPRLDSEDLISAIYDITGTAGHITDPDGTGTEGSPAGGRDESPLVPGEDGKDDPDDAPFDYGASSLLPTGKSMNPARPETAFYYDRNQVAYVVRETRTGQIRVLTSFGRLNGWALGSEHRIQHDQTGYPLGTWRVTGIRNYKTGWQAGEVPDQGIRQWVFK